MLIQRLLLHLCLFVLIGTTCVAQSFTLREELGRQWQHECVTFPLTAVQQEQIAAQRALLGPDGKPVPTQVIQGPDGRPRIVFHVDLAPYATSTWRFDEDSVRPNRHTDLKLAESDTSIRISNDQVGIAITKTPLSGAGPISGFKLNSGTWVGASRLTSDSAITQWETQVTESGPVLIEVVSRATFGQAGFWESRYRIYAGEPVILVDETFTVNGVAKAEFQLLLNDRFPATELFYRAGKGRIGKNANWTIQQGNVFAMEPWLQWWAADRRGSTFSLYHKDGNDLLTIAAREAGAWVDPDVPSEQRAAPLIQVTRDESSLLAKFPLKHGHRKWLLGAFDRDSTLSVLKDGKQSVTSPLPYRSLIKHGHFPLDVVKDYILRWPEKRTYPGLLMTPEDVRRFRASVDDLAAQRQTVKYYLRNPKLLTAHQMDRVVPAWLATNDPELGKLLVQTTMDMLQKSVNDLLDQNGLPFGAAPHMNNKFATAIGLADIVMSSPLATAKHRERIRALAAFLSYTTARPEYWSTERGYSANPNMTSMVSGYRARLAAFISDHPLAKEWGQRGMDELRSQLHDWSDENGGWLEAPHYALVAYDEILSMLVMASNAGFNDWLYSDSQVKSVIRWLAKISTPPDSRIGGHRHLPPIGNTYVHEPSGEYGLLAYLFRERDPEFSAEMQWMFHQNNRYGTPGIGGFHPAFAGYRQLLTDPDLPQKEPAYGSELFPESGVVLRDHYPSRRETYLHLIHGRNHDHYDFDSGSILLYGKGRVLADEFGYNGRSPRNQHSMVDFSPQDDAAVMSVNNFVTTPRFDYVAAHNDKWTRQIVFVKGASADSPAYFIINDDVKKAKQATWRLWLTAKKVEIKGNSATVLGTEDVDMDIFFVNNGPVALSTEEKSIRSGSGLRSDWQWAPMTTQQIGLTSAEQQTAKWNVVLFPRLHTKASPKFQSLADGRGVKVTHAAGYDYVFLSTKPFAFRDATIEFQGQAGMAQFRGGKAVLALGSQGKIRAGASEVSKPQ